MLQEASVMLTTPACRRSHARNPHACRSLLPLHRSSMRSRLHPRCAVPPPHLSSPPQACSTSPATCLIHSPQLFSTSPEDSAVSWRCSTCRGHGHRHKPSASHHTTQSTSAHLIYLHDALLPLTPRCRIPRLRNMICHAGSAAAASSSAMSKCHIHPPALHHSCRSHLPLTCTVLAHASTSADCPVEAPPEEYVKNSSLLSSSSACTLD